MSPYTVRRTLPGVAAPAPATVGGRAPDGWPSTSVAAVVGEQGGARPPRGPGPGSKFESDVPPGASFSLERVWSGER